MGHYWGAVSALVTTCNAIFALPLRFQLQDGIKRSPSEAATLVDKMCDLVCAVREPESLLVADAYYSTKSFIEGLLKDQFTYIGKMKSNTVAHEPLAPDPDPAPRRRGRPRKRGPKVTLQDVFLDKTRFVATRLHLYGNVMVVRYHVTDLLWHGISLRFVLSIYSNGTKAIFACSDASLSAEEILTAYALRFKIETSFKALVHVLGTLAYHFWMKTMPKREHGSGDMYLHRAKEAFRKAIYRKIDAYERFVNVAAIACGMLQLLAISDPKEIWRHFPVWMRTLPKHKCPTENITRLTLQNLFVQFDAEARKYVLLPKILEQMKRADTPVHPLKRVA